MRRIFNLALMALAVNFVIVSCKKNENVEDLPLPTLKFNPEKLEIEIGKTATITVIGNLNTTDKIQISNKNIIEQQGNVIDNKINFLGKKIGKTKVEILTTDNRSKGNFEVTVYGVPKSFTLAYKTNIPHYKTDINSVETYKKLIEETIKQYEFLIKEVESLPKYPLEKYGYKNQNAVYQDGVRICNELRTNYSSNKNNLDIKNAKKIYEDLYQYGICYAEVEIMTRSAELYHKEFPNNTKIEQLIKNNFSGDYSNLEGLTLTNNINNNTVKAFNEIIDIVNSLRK